MAKVPHYTKSRVNVRRAKIIAVTMTLLAITTWPALVSAREIESITSDTMKNLLKTPRALIQLCLPAHCAQDRKILEQLAEEHENDSALTFLQADVEKNSAAAATVVEQRKEQRGSRDRSRAAKRTRSGNRIPTVCF